MVNIYYSKKYTYSLNMRGCRIEINKKDGYRQQNVRQRQKIN